MSGAWTKELADELDAALLAAENPRCNCVNNKHCRGCQDEQCYDCGPRLKLARLRALRKKLIG